MRRKLGKKSVVGGVRMIEIRKIIGNKGCHMVNIPLKYLKAMGLNFGDYVELYLVDKLSMVIKKHNVKAPYGLKTAASKPPIDV
jgi:antitoxin component of MazEF toxin-antitoxin module